MPFWQEIKRQVKKSVSIFMSWFFYEIAAVKPVIINVLCYTILFMVFSRLIFWRQDYVYNVSFLFMYASVISMLMASFFCAV